MKYKLGSKSFNTKKEIKAECYRILNNYYNRVLKNGVITSPNDASFLKDLLKMHPNYIDKTNGKEVVGFFIGYPETGRRSKAGVKMSKCFWFKTSDGHKGAFSYLRCVDSATDFSLLSEVLRREVAYQTQSIRQIIFSDKAFCEISGDEIFPENGELDHVLPFNDLVRAWLEKENLSIKDVKFENAALLDRKLAEKWRLYHAEYAQYRILKKSIHRSLPRS